MKSLTLVVGSACLLWVAALGGCGSSRAGSGGAAELGGAGDAAGSGTGDGDGALDDDAAGDGDHGDGDGDDGPGTSGDDEGGGSSGSSGGAGSPPPNYVPMFPGAGTGGADEPLRGGEVCDSVPGATINAVRQLTRCFFGTETEVHPAATIEQVLECVDGNDLLHLRLTFDPGFVDNTYGAGSIGWPPKRGHRMSDLIKSDHAELVLVDGDGEIAMQFKIDYISEDASAPSGLGTLGVTGGDGSVKAGDAAHVVRVETSLHRNLNERGYGDYLVDSPPTDESLSPSAEAPEWDYRMVYEVWIDLDAFGDAGFSGAFIDYVHASPAKSPSDTIEVLPGECPPCPPDEPHCMGTPGDDCAGNDPDETCGEQGGDGDGDSPGEPLDPCADNDPDTICAEQGGDGDGDSPGEPLDPCADNDPDTVCEQGDPPPPPSQPAEPAYCDLYPTDPACILF